METVKLFSEQFSDEVEYTNAYTKFRVHCREFITSLSTKTHRKNSYFGQPEPQ